MTERRIILSTKDKLHFAAVFLQAPAVTLFVMLSAPFQKGNKTWRKHVLARLTRWITHALSNRQLRALMGPSLDAYDRWCKLHHYPFRTEPLAEEGLLFWIGPKSNNQVFLYFHGGGYALPVDPNMFNFWACVQGHMERQGIGLTGVAIVDYSLVPDKAFPTQLRQAMSALRLVLDSGVPPSGIQLVGDSAGANLILAMLSHFLHPHPTVEPAPFLSEPLKGAYLCSPWGSLLCQGGTFLKNSSKDIMSYESLLAMGVAVLEGVPDGQRPYVDYTTCGASWFSGADKVIERFLVTSGEDELLAGTIAEFAGILQRHHPDVEVSVQRDCMHNEPLFAFQTSLPLDKPGTSTSTVVKWLQDGYTKRT